MKKVYLSSIITLILSPAAFALDNSYNPAMSLILDGRYSDYSEDPESYELPGFQLGGEARLPASGFSLGHSELAFSSNIDNNFSGQATLAVAEHEGATEVEIEEAFIQTLSLGAGSSIKFGRFLSAFGYLNAHHEHAWDFADAPLMYRALFGNTLRDDGVQFNVVLPSDMFMEITAELTSGNHFPAAGNEDGGVGASLLSFTLGDDIGSDHAWQLGFSHWQANDIVERSGEAHDHGGGVTELPAFTGESEINALDFIYKWAPNGNSKETAFKFQLEYFQRSESGVIDMIGSDPLESSSYEGDQDGFYAQAIYQFMPRWRSGIRFDQLTYDNTGDDEDVLEEAELTGEDHDPQRSSVMIEWVPSEFSRIRLQYNRDQSSAAITDKQIFLQYTMSLGAHGAHAF